MMRVDLPNKIIESIKQLGEKYAIQKIVLFGSRAGVTIQPEATLILQYTLLWNFRGKAVLPVL